MAASDLCFELRRILRRYSRMLRLSKRLGQHILRGCKLSSDFASALRKLQPSKVLEVGTGIGSLTIILSRFSEKVVTIEIDPRLAYIARKVLGKHPNVEIILGDGLAFLRTSSIRADAVCANPPFNITGPLVSAIIKSNYDFALMTLQKEVAEKLVASPGTRSYGRLTVFVRTFMDVRLIGTYSPDEFLPKPEVDISLVLLSRKKRWERTWDIYEDLLRCVFSQRRKLARKILRRCLKDLPELRNCRWEKLEDLEDKRVFSLDPELLANIFDSCISTERQETLV
ncbi:MAG: ribosomal RNA small subunit methyltransferase A [Desulfurococcales archaeon]|nr:ribosomal RNA small subunit methyltransferase A [Desulfurococcales archaeon]